MPSYSTRTPPSTVGKNHQGVGIPDTASGGPNPDPKIARISPGATGPGDLLAALTIPPLVMSSVGGVSVMVADADFVRSATLVATTLTVCLVGMEAGGV